MLPWPTARPQGALQAHLLRHALAPSFLSVGLAPLHTATHSLHFRCGLRSVDFRQPVVAYRYRPGAQDPPFRSRLLGALPQTAPAPGLDPADQARSHCISLHIQAQSVPTVSGTVFRTESAPV